MEVVNEVALLIEILTSGTTQQKLNALNNINANIAINLFDHIAALTNHFNPEIRVAALRALRFIDQSHLAGIIRENLHDENKEVRLAASELFHLHDLAA
jgi:vesicle coat complex subunit